MRAVTGAGASSHGVTGYDGGTSPYGRPIASARRLGENEECRKRHKSDQRQRSYNQTRRHGSESSARHGLQPRKASIPAKYGTMMVEITRHMTEMYGIQAIMAA
jgi:hypothetical protein